MSHERKTHASMNFDGAQGEWSASWTQRWLAPAIQCGRSLLTRPHPQHEFDLDYAASAAWSIHRL